MEGKLMRGSDVGKILSKNGFKYLKQEGSHMKYIHNSGQHITVPNHKTIATGTLHSIQKKYFEIINL